jgi:hypothetical protein
VTGAKRKIAKGEARLQESVHRWSLLCCFHLLHFPWCNPLYFKPRRSYDRSHRRGSGFGSNGGCCVLWQTDLRIARVLLHPQPQLLLKPQSHWVRGAPRHMRLATQGIAEQGAMRHVPGYGQPSSITELATQAGARAHTR